MDFNQQKMAYLCLSLYLLNGDMIRYVVTNLHVADSVEPLLTDQTGRHTLQPSVGLVKEAVHQLRPRVILQQGSGNTESLFEYYTCLSMGN